MRLLASGCHGLHDLLHLLKIVDWRSEKRVAGAGLDRNRFISTVTSKSVVHSRRPAVRRASAVRCAVPAIERT